MKESDNQSTFLSTRLDFRGSSNLILERSRVYFDIQIKNNKEGRVTFQLVRTQSKSVKPCCDFAVSLRTNHWTGYNSMMMVGLRNLNPLGQVPKLRKF